MDELRQLSVMKTSFSTVNQNLLSWTPFSWTHFYQLDPFGSDQNHQNLDVPLIKLPFFVASWQSQHFSVKNNKNEQKNPLEMVSDQTQLRSKPSRIRRLPSGSDLWSYYYALKPNPRPCILVWEQTVCVRLGLLRGHFRIGPKHGNIWNDVLVMCSCEKVVS